MTPLHTLSARYRILLGSGSPRRKALLDALGLRFEVRTKAIDEVIPSEIAAHEAARYLARQKSHAQELAPNELLITADTTVVCEETVLGKPTDYDTAHALLTRLSGRAHEVVTGVCLRTSEQEVCFQVSTRVFFSALSDAEIAHYIRQHAPYDKAGGYGIQEWIGMIGVKRIEGDYYNVVGLPLHQLYQMLNRFL